MKKLLVIFLLIPLFGISQVQIGVDIDGEALGDLSGTSVSLSSDGSIVAIGALGNDDNGFLSGHVRIYENQLGVWTQIGQDIDGEAGNDQSGSQISLSSDGNIIAIGAGPNNGNGIRSGHVRIYENQSGTWIQIGQDIDGETANDTSGYKGVSLSSDGNIVAIGARHNSDNGLDSGHVRIYENQLGVWTQIGSDIDGEAEDDQFGGDVSLSSDGNIVAIGSRYNSGNGFSSGHVRIYDLSALLSVEESTLSGVKLYPNPTTNQFTIELPESQTLEKVNLYNIIGQLVLSEKLSQINTSKIASGSYIVEIITNQGKTTKKLVIE